MRDTRPLVLNACLIAGHLFAACKADPAPARTEPAIASRAAAVPRQAKLPIATSTNALVIGVQLRAEMAWNDALAQGTPEAWDLAADMFLRARDACRGDCTELAYATVLARSHALKADPALARPVEKPIEPEPLPARVEAFVDAADVYAMTIPDDDVEGCGVKFLAGQQYNNYGWIDESTTRFAHIVLANPSHETALYSANLMLDAFNRSERFDDLLRWARELSGNHALMAAQPELAVLVADILSRAARGRGERL